MRYSALWGLALFLAGGIVRTSPALAGEVRIPIGPFSGGSAITTEVKSIKELREEGIVRQQMDFTCGAASVATIFTYFLQLPCQERDVIDFIIAHNEAREMAMRRGFTLLDLKQFAEAKGVQAAGYRLSIEQLYGANTPVLVPIVVGKNLRHFVVFLGMKGDNVFLADPATGRRTIPRSVFEQIWDLKIAMVFSKPNLPALNTTVLSIRSVDETTLPTALIMTIAIPSTSFYFHGINEF